MKVRKKFMLQTYKLQNKIPRAKFVCFYKAEIFKPEWYFQMTYKIFESTFLLKYILHLKSRMVFLVLSVIQ